MTPLIGRLAPFGLVLELPPAESLPLLWWERFWGAWMRWREDAGP